MNITAVVAWMWLAAQTGNMKVPSVTWCCKDCDEAVCSVHANAPQPVMQDAEPVNPPPPAEHVIEIRDGRKYYERRHPKDCYPAGVFYQTRKDGSVDCFRVTREIWIDGKKWGVLKESNK